MTVPGSFFETKVDREALPTTVLVQSLKRAMIELKPTQMAHHDTPKTNVPESLKKTDHVFIRTDAIKQPLVCPYTGLFSLQFAGKTNNVMLMLHAN